MNSGAAEDLGNGRRWPVRAILVAVVFALIVPGLIFCGVLLRQIANSERSRALDAAQAAAQRTADTLDREIGNLGAALVTLGTAPALDSGDMAAFVLQARAAAAALGHSIVLADTTGQQIVNTARPPGTPMPMMSSMETVRKVIETRATVVSTLFDGVNADRPSLAVEVPIIRNGTLRYILAINVSPASLSGILEQQNLPQGWIATVFDANNRVIARNVDIDSFIGAPAGDDGRAHLSDDRGAWIGRSMNGTLRLATTQRLHLADWLVLIGIPEATVEAPLRSTITLLAITGSVTLILAFLLAWRLADSVAKPLQGLARAAIAGSAGLPLPTIRSNIAEVHAVGQGLLHATRDLRSRAETLAAERAQLAAIIETVPVGLIIAEAPTGRVVSGNRQVEQMLRHPVYPSAGLGDYDRWIAHHPDGRRVEGHEYPLARVLAGERGATLRCLYQRGDGTNFWLDIIGAPILGPDGAVTGGLVVLLDIDEAVRARQAEARFADHLEGQVTERTAALQAANQRLRDEMAARAVAEEQLRQAQKMEAVGQLTGGIAHDFNNLLTIVVGSLDLLRRRTEDRRTQRLLDNALDGAGRAATLVARLLAFSRRQPLLPQPVDANRLVEGMSDLFHRTLGESIDLHMRLAPALWRTHADPNQLESALLNLAVNARDATMEAHPDGGILLIETENVAHDCAFSAAHPDVPPGEYVRIAVTDRGAGMTDELAARVFEPFFTTKQPGHGTGLGLSQVHGFVKQSGGHVAIRSAPDQGTTVTIELPRFHGPSMPDIGEPGIAAIEAAPGLMILLVEDEDAVRRYSVEALQELGHAVIEASDATAALRLLDAQPGIDLLFTDVVLSHMSGIQLAAEVRRRRPGLPVLFTSGYTPDLARIGNSLRPGDILLRKPYKLPELAAKLQKAMRPAGLEPATKPL